MPIAVFVKLDNYNGPTFYNTYFVPICLISLACCTAENCERQQVPLKLTLVVTIYKSDGLTIQKTIVD